MSRKLEEIEKPLIVFTQEKYNKHIKDIVDKAYEAGKLDAKLSLTFDNPKARYLNSLKLDL